MVHTNLYDRPVLPDNHKELFNIPFIPYNNYHTFPNVQPKQPKLIPRVLWIGMRKKTESLSTLSTKLQDLVNRSSSDGWFVNLLGHEEQLDYLERFWPNTAVLWAFKAINPRLGIAACDIWRYAALYSHGGLYLDDDSYLQRPLEDIVLPNDTIILSKEKNRMADACFVDSFHLSEFSILKRYCNYTGWRLIYGGHTFINWGIFAAPRHIVLLSLLQNVVDVVRAEYKRLPVVWMLNTDHRWKIVMW